MLLPITSYKHQIVEAVRNHAFTIVCAETGSGKSTQIPQYLSEYYQQVVVTEPRIMAAKTLAKRVSEEMNVTLGQEVGYRTAYDKCSSPESKILFCTDGLQLVRTMFDQNHQRQNVLIIDEVHEWNLNIETLIAWCKFMQGKWNTKVVIMSATLDTETLAQYYGEDVAVLNIPGNLYDVEVEERPKESLIRSIRDNIHLRKNILVFVPGKKEISKVIKELSEEDATILPLHSEMDWNDQKKCFEKYENPKVIVATNVAQTSVTIPDIDVVIDNGEARISIAEEGIQGLFLKDISKADIMQRKGRAGRTKNGKYILCSDTAIQYRNEITVPEIQRSILDRVVLQLASIGLDAEKLEFYHQPDKQAIVKAKKELASIGAFDSNNQVTELGNKMVKMPVSVQLARMIAEAEKYGVTEPVITIAAIIEMGGLLAKGRSYSSFTIEKNSDLLAELDVWNELNKLDYINFKELCIKKKVFFRIKEHIKRLHEVLYGIVEITNNDDREAILKSCLSGLTAHIYVNRGYEGFYGEDGISRKLDQNSCVNQGSADFLVGIPKTIEFDGMWGIKRHLNLVSFASKIEADTLMELVPNEIYEKTELTYAPNEDAVRVITRKYFRDCLLDFESHLDYQNPSYGELKAEYEKAQEFWRTTNTLSRQETVEIDGKSFTVHYWGNKKTIYLDEETLFTTKVKEVFLDNGQLVWVMIGMSSCQASIPALRNIVEHSRINSARKSMKDEYANIKVTSLSDVLLHSSKLGKVQFATSNGGYGGTPIYTHGCIFLKKNTVLFKIEDDEELANSNTLEALQYLFIKEVKKRYGDSKFSHQQGKKKKELTDSEKEMKKDFDSLVREMLPNLTVNNSMENLDFLEEYYQELMG